MARIDVAIVSADAALRAEVALLFGGERYRAFEAARAIEAIGDFDAGAEAHVVFAVFSSLPSTAELQALLDTGRDTRAVTICALRGRPGARETHGLFAVGLHEIVHLGQLDPGAVDTLVASCLERERDRRGLVRAGERALLGRDVAAAMVVAGSARAIRDAFSHGMLALGAVAVACWARAERRVSLLGAHGAPIERGQVTELAFDAAHPVVRAALDGVTRWYRSAAGAHADHADFHPVVAELALGVLPVRRGDEVAELVLVATLEPPDDAERHATEELCALLGETLRRAQLQAELEEQRATDRRLLSVIGRDLADPLNTIAVGARLLHGGFDAPSTASFTPIELAAQNALRLVENALTFARSAAGGLDLVRRDHDVFSLLASAVTEGQRRARGGRALTLDLGASAAIAMVDAGRIDQALANLLSNALTHSPEGSTVRVRGTSDEHAVYIDVENRSHGLGPVAIDEILESMKRLPAASARGSAGMGLFLVDKIVEAHGGRAWAESFDPDGIRLSLQLPRLPDGGPELGAVAAGALPSTVERELPLDEGLRALVARFRHPALARIFEVWWHARGSNRMPHPLDIDRSRLLAYLPDMVSATVSVGLDGEPVFTWASIGPRLERRLRGTLPKNLDAANEQRNAQYAMYRRCYQRQEPTYDYVRQRGPRAYSFERLLLPMTRIQSYGPSDILGLVVFSDPLE